MGPTIHHVDLANLFVGDDDPTSSLFLVLRNVQLPNLQEKVKTFSPGGGVMELELGLRKLDPLRLTFQTEGVTPDLMPRFMPAEGRINYTMRANVRDVNTHADLELKAVINGRMIQNNLGQLGGGDGAQTDYAVAEIMRYQLWFDNVEKFRFDAFLGPAGIWVDGQQPFRRAAANLGLV